MSDLNTEILLFSHKDRHGPDGVDQLSPVLKGSILTPTRPGNGSEHLRIGTQVIGLDSVTLNEEGALSLTDVCIPQPGSDPETIAADRQL